MHSKCVYIHARIHRKCGRSVQRDADGGGAGGAAGGGQSGRAPLQRSGACCIYVYICIYVSI